MTMAIGHADGDAVVLDLVREVAPPFQTDQVTADFSEIMLNYGVTTAISDRVGLGWVSKAFSDRGITLQYSTKTKSEIYLAALPLLGNGSVELLDHPRLKIKSSTLNGASPAADTNRSIIPPAIFMTTLRTAPSE